jgi:hypothetical protein
MGELKIILFVVFVLNLETVSASNDQIEKEINLIVPDMNKTIVQNSSSLTTYYWKYVQNGTGIMAVSGSSLKLECSGHTPLEWNITGYTVCSIFVRTKGVTY